MFQEFNHVSVDYISSSVPAHAVGNSFFSALLTEKEIKVFEKTVGIKERAYNDKGIPAGIPKKPLFKFTRELTL